MGKKDNYVDGFMALRAAQRAAQDKRAAREGSPSSATGPPSAQGKERGGAGGGPPIASHAHKTVMPTKYEVVCYECGYTFKQAGRAQHTSCPKCRAVLDFVDRVIDGEWSDTMKTAGQVTVKPGGVVKGGELFAADIIVQGRIEGGRAEAYRWLDLYPEGFVDLERVTMRDLRVRAGSHLVIERPAKLRHVELEGHLRADLELSGGLHVKRGGCLDGSVKGAQLRVDEGGGLRADIDIRNADFKV